jgi:hypothetical protein
MERLSLLDRPQQEQCGTLFFGDMKVCKSSDSAGRRRFRENTRQTKPGAAI